jgi:gliding motility-associated protein GldM
MAGGKLSPRQKMINMMYLVLMALLALNVSAEILKSFYLFEKSFNNAAKSIDSKSAVTIKALEKAMEEKAQKTKPYMDRAKGVQKTTQEFITYVNDLSNKVNEWYGGRDPLTGALVNPDQMEAHAKYFTVDKDGANGKEFQDKINETREKIASYLKPQVAGMPDSTNIKDNSLYESVLASSQLVAKDDNEGVNKATWISGNLEHNPAAGLAALLSRIKNDAKTMESDVLEKLATRIDATDYKFDRLEAKVLAKSTYVMEGESYEADILLVASNSKGVPSISVGGSPINVEGGVGKFRRVASGVGVKTFAGQIVIDGPDGPKAFEFKDEFTVFKPAATIAATEMNLLYKGIDNPMSISVPGFAASEVRVSAPGINLKSLGGGLYSAKVPSSTNNEVTISASITKDGKTKTVGSAKFRVRSLPQPTAQLGGIPNDGLPKGRASVMAQTSILASMGAGFAYNLQYRVTGFKMIMAYKRRPPVMANSNNGMLTPEMQGLIRSAGADDRILFEGIRASEAKYGFNANLSPIIITIR